MGPEGKPADPRVRVISHLYFRDEPFDSDAETISQPAGAGFSSPSPDPKHQVGTLEQAGEDFVDFMHQFMTNVFPKLSKNTLHIAAESFGGRWAPYFMHRLKSLANVQAATALPNPLGSIILVNAVIGTVGGDITTAYYEFGCSRDGAASKLGFGFNSTICDLIQEFGPMCEYYATLCEFTDNLSVCDDAARYRSSHETCIMVCIIQIVSSV